MRNDEPILIVNGANVQCTSGTFTLRDNSSTGSVSTNGGTFSLSCEVRSGAVEALNNINDYTATIPAGQVGVWAGSGTATVKADNFKATSLATFGDVDGRWFSSDGGASITGGKLEFSNSDDVEQQAVRRGFRGGKYIMEYDHPVVSLNKNGVVLHWQDPENFMIVLFDKGVSNVTPRLAKREGGDYTAISSGSAFSMSNGDRVRIVIQDHPGNSALQELQVDVNGTVRLTSTAIDDDWSAGSVGFYVKSGSGGTLSYDNFKVGYDNNADDDIADAGDDIQIDDDFASNAITLTYDDNGNLTDDGIFKFVYDAWNRMVKVQRRPEPTETKSLVATYAYDGANRRASKVVTNSGVETYPNDGGETTVHFYYGGVEPKPTPFGGIMPKCWNIFETRNGSNQTTWQYFWGTQYVDEIILTDKNGDATVGNDCDPDGTAGEGSESPADHRYFYHQDRSWNVAALTHYGVGTNGAHVERYVYGPYGEALCRRGASGSGELASLSAASVSGNVVWHHGLHRDGETLGYQNRRREYSTATGCFRQREPLDRAGAPRARREQGAFLGPYAYVLNNPITNVDPDGRACVVWCNGQFWPCIPGCSAPPPPPPPRPTEKPDLPPFALRTYGNCCGTENKCPPGQPLPGDCTDSACAAHDACLGSTEHTSPEALPCHCRFVEDLKSCSPDPGSHEDGANAGMQWYFCSLMSQNEYECPACASSH